MSKYSQHFVVLAILFGVLSIGLVAMSRISVKAEGNGVGGAITSNNTNIAPSKEIKVNTSTGNVDSVVESEKNSNKKPAIEASKPESCSYTYSSWSICSSSGNQTRTVTSKTPSGCYSSADPILKQSCKYISSKNKESVCVYTLSDWGLCNSSGTQNREIISRAPVGCNDSNTPNLQKTCTANSSTEGKVTINKDTLSQNSTVTPPFIFLNINGGEVISEQIKIQGNVDNAQSVEFYLVPAGSNISKYLGLGKKVNDNFWEFYFDSKKQPNGSYHIKTKIKNIYGSYDGGQRMMIVSNAGENSNPIEAESLKGNQENQSIAELSKEWQKKYFKIDACVDKNICGGMADPDGDGINNDNEYRYGTIPVNPDSDGDGFLDGDEVKDGYNPLKSSPGDKSDKIVFESPKEKGEISRELYQVNNVEMIQSESGTKKIKISGKGIPNSFVTIYLYSDPIILTVKTDDDGAWSYEVDKAIEDGEHQIYVAVTDNAGKITAKSEPLIFVKTAEAATVIPTAEVATVNQASPVKNQTKKDSFALLALVVGGLALALASIGLYKLKKEVTN